MHASQQNILARTEQFALLSKHTPQKIQQFADFIAQKLENIGEKCEKRLSTVPGNEFWLEGSDLLGDIMQAIWGCKAYCPFCMEPCQHSDQNHTTGSLTLNHECLQHRPLGLTGHFHEHKYQKRQTLFHPKVTVQSNKLSHQSCNYKVATFTEFAWACVTECEYPFHEYRKYKEYFSDWEICPDRGFANKYWCWVMARFEKDILAEYKEQNPAISGVCIPEYFRRITMAEALASLTD